MEILFGTCWLGWFFFTFLIYIYAHHKGREKMFFDWQNFLNGKPTHESDKQEFEHLIEKYRSRSKLKEIPSILLQKDVNKICEEVRTFPKINP